MINPKSEILNTKQIQNSKYPKRFEFWILNIRACLGFGASCLVFGLCFCALSLGTDLYPLPSDYSIKRSSTNIHSEHVSGFANYTALKTGHTYEKIRNMEIKGYGRTEILIICLIAKKSNNEIDNLIKSRDEGKRLKEIAESNKVIYRDVYLEAKTLKQKIETTMSAE